MRFLPVIAGTLLLLAVASFAGRCEEPFLRVVVPESDTTTTLFARHRLAASTNPGNTVAVNGTPLKVYPSGAFVALLDLNVGENFFTIAVTKDTGQSVSTSFLIIRTKPPETSRLDTLAIDSVMMEPATDLWVLPGDLLKVQFKGTPGCKASFFYGIPMRELPLTEANGLRGVYQGVYKIQSADRFAEVPVEYTLTDSAGRSVSAESRGRVKTLRNDVPLVGLTRGERPFLNFGLGEDRLGGAKMSFLNPGIKLMITGKVGPQYRVALNGEREAWIPEELVELQPAGTYPPFSLTGSWNVYGEERYDYVTVTLTDRLPYASFVEFDPTRIILEVYGAVSNTNWITQQLTTREVRSVAYAQASRNVFRLTVELAHRQVWGYDVSYRGTMLVLRVRRQPEDLSIGRLTVALDAGHGGENEGAVGSTGLLEKDVNLATVMHLKSLLQQKGAGVVLTRTDDTFSSMNDRVRKVIDSGADILISVHANSIGSTSDPEAVKGVSTYYKYPCYQSLSLSLLQELVKSDLASFGNIGGFNFALNSPTELPNALVELAFLSNPEDEMKLLDDEFRKELAQRILEGVKEFLNSCEED